MRLAPPKAIRIGVRSRASRASRIRGAPLRPKRAVLRVCSARPEASRIRHAPPKHDRIQCVLGPGGGAEAAERVDARFGRGRGTRTPEYCVSP